MNKSLIYSECVSATGPELKLLLKVHFVEIVDFWVSFNSSVSDELENPGCHILTLWVGGWPNSPPKASVFNKFGILPTGPLNEMIWSMEHFLFLSPNILRDRHRTYCLATMIQQLTYVRVKKAPENFRRVILILTFKTCLRTASSVIFALKKIRLAAALIESWDTLGHKGCTGWTLHNGGLVGHI